MAQSSQAAALRVCALVAFLSTSLAHAAAPTRIDMIEHIFGATAVHAVSGHGRLTIGVAQDGDLTVLAWPTPSYADQLAFVTSNAIDARQWPRFGAVPASGLFLGLQITQAGGQAVVWLHDPTVFAVQQDYGPTDGSAIHTRFVSQTLGLEVLVVDAVWPGAAGALGGDAMVRQVTVTATGQVAVTALRTYANLSPQPPNSRLAELPLVDWGLDGRNDFAAVWDAKAQAIVHFHPNDHVIYDQLLKVLAQTFEYGAAADLLKNGTPPPQAIAQFADNLDTAFAPGAFVALSTLPAPMAHHVGYDNANFCGLIGELLDNAKALPQVFPGFVLPINPAVLDGLRCAADHQPMHQEQGWKHQAISAFEAATRTDAWPGSDVAAGEVDDLLVTALPVVKGQSATVTVTLGLGATAAAAKQALATASDGPKVVAQAEAALVAASKVWRLPTSLSATIVAVARRALINIRVAMDAGTGAIVASIARQPPYALDWPRDGAFFTTALDVSGQASLAALRTEMYAKWQRKDPVPPTGLIDPPPAQDPVSGKADTYPAGAWEMNYYTDGMTGGNLRFEIDNTAFALWSMCAHAGWAPDAAAHLNQRWPAIASAANLLARWRDPTNELQAAAQEDDNASPTQTLHGAITTYGALKIAAHAAKATGHSEEQALWSARADALAKAIAANLFDVKSGLFTAAANTTANPGSQASGPTAWLVWPFRLLDWADPRVEKQLASDFAAISPAVNLTDPEGGAYFLKNLVSLALARGQDKAWRPKLLAALQTVAGHATVGTHHFGEVMVPVGVGAAMAADQRVATPHVWEGTLFYLTAMALHAPAELQKDQQLFEPAPAAPPKKTPASSSCTSSAQSVPNVWWLGALVLFVLSLRRRRGSRC